MEEQLFCDALLTAFGIIGVLLVIFFSTIIICFIAHEICWSWKEYRRRKRIKFGSVL